jgi:hypothetical protein
MSAEELSLVVGLLLSLLFSYVPGFKGRFEALATETKRLVMAGLLVLVAVGSYGVACWNILDVGVSCDQPGIVGLVTAFIAALVANQATYLISPKVGGGDG